MNRKKIIFWSIFLSVLCIFGNFNSIYAYQESDTNIGNVTIKCAIGSEKYITYDSRLQTVYRYYYKNSSGEEIPAYCLQLNTSGAEEGEYSVDTSKELNDEVVKNIILNGYPYQDCVQYNLYTPEEKQFATQFAIWAYKKKLNLDLIKATKSDYERIVKGIKEIYKRGTSGTILNNNVNLIPIDEEFKIDDIDNKYYSRRYRPELNLDMVIDYRPQDENIKMTNEFNYELGKFSTEKIIKFLVPRDKVTKDMDFKFNILVNAKEDVVLFGKPPASRQEVAVALNPIITYNFDFNLGIKYIPTSLKIIKVDKEDNEIKIPNTKFRFIDKTEGKVLGECTTNENGEIIIDLKKEFGIFDDIEIIVQEVKSNEKYYLDKENSEYVIKIKADSENTLTVQNEKIKGKIKIYKTSKKYNKLSKLDEGSPLEGTEFNILDESGNIVDTVITNKEGIAITKELLKGKYYIKEIKSSNYYVMSSDVYEVQIEEHNKEVEVNITNDNVEYFEKLPNTGK